MTRSLGARLVIGSALAVIAVLVASGIVMSRFARASLDDELDEAVRARAHELAAQVELDDGKVTSEIDPRTLPASEAFCVWNGDAILGSTLGIALPRGGDGDVRTIELPAGPARAVSIVFEPRREPGQPASTPAPRLNLTFARATAPVDAVERRITWVIVGVAASGLLLCIGFLILAVRVGLRPVRTLAADIAEIRDLSTSGVTVTTQVAELEPIAGRLTELLARLAIAFERERELTGEVAHELRTPLSGLRVILEVVLDRERPAERYRTALVECLTITRETEGVVETLLALARLDANQAAVATLPVDVDQLVRDVLAASHARAQARRLVVITELAAISRDTDRDKLRSVITNLVNNAVSYADDGGEVRVVLTSDRLVVSNTGCTLDPVLLPKVFERFWRADHARSSPGHVGLGLALCKKLMSLLGGDISVGIADGRFIATVVLP